MNGERLTSGDRLRQDLATLVFTPDRLAVVKGGPATRRAYLDRVVGRLLPARAAIPNEYATALGQRNAGLRRVRAGFSTRDAISPWTARVAELGEALVRARREAVELLSPAFTEAAGDLGLADAALTYDGEPPTVADLDARLEGDIERGVTGIGPHLHELRIDAGGRDLRVFGSQGEQRIAVLGLVLAEAEVLRDRSGALAARPPRRRPVGARRRAAPGTRADDRAGIADGGHGDVCGGAADRAGAGAVGDPRAGPMMERLGGSVERELSRSGSRDAIPLAALTAAWPSIVGDAIARNAWPLRIGRDGTLHVATASATWAQELALLSEELLDRLRTRLGADAPARLRCAVGPIPEAEEPVEPTP